MSLQGTPNHIVVNEAQIELAGMIGLDGAITLKLSIGNYRVSGFECKTKDMNGEGVQLILGNDLLKRFNLVFDSRNDYLYMQPNSLTNTDYGKRDEYYVVRVVVVTFILIGVANDIQESEKKGIAFNYLKSFNGRMFAAYKNYIVPFTMVHHPLSFR